MGPNTQYTKRRDESLFVNPPKTWGSVVLISPCGRKAVIRSPTRALCNPRPHNYPALADECGLLINMNVLVGEDKHRAFKKWIYTTNHRHSEKDLLTKENQR